MEIEQEYRVVQKYENGQRFIDLTDNSVWEINRLERTPNGFPYYVITNNLTGWSELSEKDIDLHLKYRRWLLVYVTLRTIEEKGNIKLKGKKVFANEKVTILRVGDKKFIAKNTDEVYDLEKGIMMALLKSEGYTYQDIKQLMDRARPVSEINKK